MTRNENFYEYLLRAQVDRHRLLHEAAKQLPSKQKRVLVTLKILIAHPMDPSGNRIGGISTFLRNFVKFLPVGFRVKWIGITTDNKARPVGRWEIINAGKREIEFLPVLYVKDENKRTIIPLVFRFVAAVIKNKRVIQLNISNCVLSFNRIESVIPFVFSINEKHLFIHGHPKDLRNPDSEVRWKKITVLYFLLEKILLKRVDKIYFVRKDAAEVYRKKFPELRENISFLPTWADDEVFYPFPQGKKQQVRKLYEEKYNISSEEKIVLFVGRFEGQKNPLLLLEVFSHIVSEYSNVKLLLVGCGGLEVKMKSVIESYRMGDKVVFCGLLTHDKLAEVMNISDVFLLTSAFEGMPRCVVESVACGLPVVTTDVGEVRRVVKEGVSGRVVAERDPQALSRATLDMLNDPCYNDKKAVRMCAADYFALNVLTGIYNSLRNLSKN